MFINAVVHGTRKDVPVRQDSRTPPQNVGVASPEQGGGAFSQSRPREQKGRELRTVLDFMQSKYSTLSHD